MDRSRPLSRSASLFVEYAKRCLPFSPGKLILSLKQFARNRRRWLVMFLEEPSNCQKIQVSYGHEHVPGRGEMTYGGMVKFQRLQEFFPNNPYRFNLLYLGSSSLPSDWSQLVGLARGKGIPIVLNQNGVAYPGWHGPGWEKFNLPMKQILSAADYVFYQSQFCRVGADRFLGVRQGKSEILYNSVDTDFFTPANFDPNPNQLVLLLGGNQYQYYRLESAIRTAAIVSKQYQNTRLLVTGRLCWIPDPAEAHRIAVRLALDLGIPDNVVFLGPYSQADAPKILQRADVLLHTKYNDPCPSLVVEAMACGLPVAYSQSGGVPELVGSEAGVGVPVELSWEQGFPPDPVLLSEAVLRVAERRKAYAEAARQRAVEYFDLRPWVKRHREVFETLLCER